jgi:hypothetical protein
VGETTITIAAPNTFLVPDSVSVRIDAPTVGPLLLTDSVAVQFGSPATSPGPILLRDGVSVATGPVIQRLSPNGNLVGTSTPFVLTGLNLAGVTGLVFLRDGVSDATITVGSLAVDGAGTQVTTTLTVATDAAAGPRIVVVRTLSGDSIPIDTGVNIFTVSTP